MRSILSTVIIKMLRNIVKKLTEYESMKMVIIVRTDLYMRRGKIASQVAHAAVMLYRSSIENSNPCLQTWLRCGQPKIVLKIDKDCENAMKNIYHSAINNNLNVCMVRDAGKTQVDVGTLTAIGIGPNKAEEIDKITASLKLL